MYSFQNTTTPEEYKRAKLNKGIEFEYVPNTAAGFENSRKYVICNGYKYFVSANTEKDYFVSCDDIQCPSDKKWSLWFSVEGDTIKVEAAICNNRAEKSEKYLKKYAPILCLIHSCIKYSKIVKYPS